MLFFIERVIFRSCSLVVRRFCTSREAVFSANEKNVEAESQNFALKSLKIAIIGLPNAGKSTLVNQLINRTVCATSCKVHTTQVSSEAISVEGDTQLIFIDTPGLVSNRDFKRYKLDETFRKDVNKSLKMADIVGVVEDMINPKAQEKISERTLTLLEAYGRDRPTILILNKIDKLKKKKRLLEIVRNLTNEKNWPHFIDIFMISALNNEGVDDLRNYFLDSAKRKNWEYDSKVYTNQPPELVIERTVKAALLDYLPQELPYLISVQLEDFNVSADGSITTMVRTHCPTKRICKVVLGPGGQRIKDIALHCERALSNGFRAPVRIRIAVEFPEEKKQ